MKAPRKAKAVLSEHFRVFETDIFINDIKTLQPSIREKLILKLRKHVYLILKEQPYFGKNIRKLQNFNPETRRFRIGYFRLFYTIDDKSKIISMLTISDRKDAC